MPNKSSPVDQELIRALADLLNESDLAEIEVEQEDFRVRITRSFRSEVMQMAPAPVPATSATPPPPVPAATPPGAPAVAAADEFANNPGVVTSPMVGTAYHAAEPSSPPFVEVGSKVSEGETVLIIEAMKTMNHIPAHRSGTVTRILVENAQPVEYGEPLLVIE
jgi:acetyl-CoA carboxylase biotin carboxyl carrier protein